MTAALDLSDTSRSVMGVKMKKGSSYLIIQSLGRRVVSGRGLRNIFSVTKTKLSWLSRFHSFEEVAKRDCTLKCT